MVVFFPRLAANETINGSWTFNGNVYANTIVGKEYIQTSVSGSTSIIDTGIMSNMLSGIFFICGYSNPDSSNANYRDPFSGYIYIGTGTTGTQTQTYITYQEIFKADRTMYSSSSTLNIEVLFWNGTTESDNCIYSSINHQIRIKISGFVGTVGSNQKVFLTRIS